jgi:hypothetical protein
MIGKRSVAEGLDGWEEAGLDREEVRWSDE